MERPVNINLHESLEGVEDRSCLVMDDDGPFVQRLARALAQRGFIVSAVTNVAEGKDIARLNPPAFAVLDLRLEDGSGLDVVEVLQKSRPEARAVILTGYGAIATAVAAVKAGAVDYLSKPADVEDIIRALTATTDESPHRPKTRCPPTGCAGNTSSVCTSCAITMSRKRPAA
jgi:two-component system response regulator RegA